jgi:hypothetical protein
MVHTCNAAIQQAPGLLKSKAKRAGGVVEMVQRLPSKHEFKPRYHKKKKKKDKC